MLSIISSSLPHSIPLHRWGTHQLPPLRRPRRLRLLPCPFPSSNEDSAPLDYNPVELLDLDASMQSRTDASGAAKLRSWFGPNGQYIRELPCPSCRGRGYTPCTECGIERSRADCSQCNGKGIRTCRRCLGDCVIWEESIDERPWEKARSRSHLKVKEDDEVDKLEIKLAVTRKSKRIYQSTSPEVISKISRSLRGLNFSADTAGRKGTGVTTAQHYGKLQVSFGLNVVYAVRGGTIVEHVGGHGPTEKGRQRRQ